MTITTAAYIMNYSTNHSLFDHLQQIASLVAEIKNKQVPKEVKQKKIDALSSVVRFLSDQTFTDELEYILKDVFNDLASVLTYRQGSYEYKMKIAEICVSIAFMTPSLLQQHVFKVTVLFEDCHAKSVDEMTVYCWMFNEFIMKIKLFNYDEAYLKIVITDILTAVECVLQSKKSSPTVIIALMDIIKTVAQQFPYTFNSFSTQFAHLVVEELRCRESKTVQESCRSTLVGLSEFFASDQEYGTMLLNEYVQDLFDYQEKMNTWDQGNPKKSNKSVATAKATILTIAPLLSMYLEIQGPASPLVTKIIEDILSLCNAQQFNMKLVSVPSRVEYFSSYCHIFEIALKMNNPQIVSSITTVVSNMTDKLMNHPSAIIRTFRYYEKLINLYDTYPQLVTSLIQPLLRPDGVVEKITSWNNSELAQAVSDVISAFLAVPSLDILQQSYGCLVNIIQADLEILLRNHETLIFSSINTHLIEARLTIIVKSLAKVAALKNSLIVMMGLQPCLLVLLLDTFPITESWFLSSCPTLTSALLSTVTIHVKSHEFFLPSSDWIQNNALMAESMTRNHLHLQIDTLVQLLACDIEWKVIWEYIYDWLCSLFASVSPETLKRWMQTKRQLPELTKLIRARILKSWSNESIRELSVRLGCSVNASDKEAVSITSDVKDTIQKLDVQEGVELWSKVDPRIYIKCSLSEFGWNRWEKSQVRAMNGLFFGVEDFHIWTNFLLKEVLPSTKKNAQCDETWINEAVLIGYGRWLMDNHASKSDTFATKWRWTLIQLANFCIENKMKTPLGKPMETFNSFGAEINRLAKLALKTSTTEDKKVHKVLLSRKEKEDEDDYGKTRPLTDEEEWWRVRCLIEFVDILGKLMFTAHSGSLFPITSISQAAKQFFVTNADSCREWLLRIYPPAMVIAFYNGYYAQVIQFGSCVLNNLEKKIKKTATDGDSEKGGAPPEPVPSFWYPILGWCGRAMAEIGAEQATKGLKAWVMKVHKQDMKWLDGFIEMSSARYEAALACFCQTLAENTVPESAKIIVRQMCLDVLRRLRYPLFLDREKCPPNFSIYNQCPAGLVPDGFDADALASVTQLCSFGFPEKTTYSYLPWDASQVMDQIEMTLMQTLRRADVQELKTDISKFGHITFSGDSGLRLLGRIASVDRISSAVLTKMCRSKDYAVDSSTLVHDLSPLFLLKDRRHADIGERFSIARRFLFWTERLTNVGANSAEIYLETACLARKTGNYIVANEMLQRSLKNSICGQLNIIKTVVQRAKLLWSAASPEQRRNEWMNVFVNLSQEMDFQLNRETRYLQYLNSDADEQNHGEVVAKTCLHLASWLQTDPQVISAGIPPGPLRSQLESIQIPACIGQNDFVHRLLAFSAMSAPGLAKSHLRLANWAYAAAKGYGQTKEVFDYQCQRQLEQEVSSEVLERLYNAAVTSTSPSQLEGEVRVIVNDDFNLLRLLLARSGFFMSFWDQSRESRLLYLPYSVSEYFSYIATAGRVEGSENNNSMGTVSATLRLLDLLVNHSDILQGIINDGFANTNELLWKDILPQLFARLSHPLQEVRYSITQLLSRIGKASPHSVVFQILTGASEAMVVEESDDVVGAEKEEDDSEVKDKSLMYEACKQLETNMMEFYPALVKDTREFIAELQKINLLYEERWIFVLTNLDHEMSRRLDQIRVETKRTMNSHHLDEKAKVDIVSEKTRLITTSVYRILRDLYESTCLQPTNTPNEKAFVDSYGDMLKTAFDQSTANAKTPEKAWAPFKHILELLLRKNARRGGQELVLENISTYLSELKGSCVPIPGQDDKDFSEVINLESLRSKVIVLPTKTRPKKMTFVGDDGKEQMFLFKGQEDLHLDERIMQLLHICNLMLSSSNKRSWPSYQARHYGVTPLGTRSGLIQWVGGATPMFHLYRRWQMRQVQSKVTAAAAKAGGAPVPSAEVERPTDMYHKALRTAFAAHNVDPAIVSDRSKWPKELLKEVLVQLIKDTAPDILSRELWLRAGSGDTWWRVVSRLSRSSAVMSMIGAVLGLGDRHLDNVLVNLDTGNIVHIDYNICFDKGRNLRVPETVPFRLTQNFIQAYGPTKIEGIFRESCNHVLSVLRSGREILLTVLDAFIYDPLVDWAASDHLTTSSGAVSVAVTLAVYGTDSRAAKAKPVARGMFSVRVREMRMAWASNKVELSRALLNVREALLQQANGVPASAWSTSDMLEQKRVESGRQLKSAITAHRQMMKDFRPLLRALATCDDRFAQYLKDYRDNFGEPLVKAHQLVDAKQNDLSSCIALFEVVFTNITRIYEGLCELDAKEVTSSSTTTTTSTAATTPVHKESPVVLASSVPPGLESWHMRRQEQEQNAHARGVVKQVQARLEGRLDKNDVGDELSVVEQVDRWILCAKSNSKLSLMYEGWTAWM